MDRLVYNCQVISQPTLPIFDKSCYGGLMSAEAAVRGRGRPREFEVSDVIDSLIDIFWAQGYEATSMSDIVEATGLNKSSLYNSFGSKEELFQTAVTHYVEMRQSMLHGALRDGDAGIDDIMTFLEFVEQEFGGEFGSRGCLAVNTTTELGGRDESVITMSAGYRNEIRTSLRAALDRSAAAGEIDVNSVAHYAEMMLAFLMSLSVMARGGASSDEIKGQLAAIRALIESWRIDG
jgi:AcrR family transcriptional regulator